MRSLKNLHNSLAGRSPTGAIHPPSLLGETGSLPTGLEPEEKRGELGVAAAMRGLHVETKTPSHARPLLLAFHPRGARRGGKATSETPALTLAVWPRENCWPGTAGTTMAPTVQAVG